MESPYLEALIQVCLSICHIWLICIHPVFGQTNVLHSLMGFKDKQHFFVSGIALANSKTVHVYPKNLLSHFLNHQIILIKKKILVAGVAYITYPRLTRHPCSFPEIYHSFTSARNGTLH